MSFNETDFINGLCSSDPVKEYQLSEEEKASGEYIDSEGNVVK